MAKTLAREVRFPFLLACRLISERGSPALASLVFACRLPSEEVQCYNMWNVYFHRAQVELIQGRGRMGEEVEGARQSPNLRGWERKEEEGLEGAPTQEDGGESGWGSREPQHNGEEGRGGHGFGRAPIQEEEPQSKRKRGKRGHTGREGGTKDLSTFQLIICSHLGSRARQQASPATSAARQRLQPWQRLLQEEQRRQLGRCHFQRKGS